MSLSQGMPDKKIAVMGGTFDPIHYGHLVAAEAVYCELLAQCVIFIPTGSPPHKKTRVTDAEARFQMTALAIEANPHFTVSRMEIDREGETYTIDTIKHLQAEYPEAEIFFIIGADEVHQIPAWHRAEDLLKLCSFIAVTRPGYDVCELKKEIEQIKERFSGRLQFLEIPALAISSSDIRSRCCVGKSIRYLLPESVENFIYKECMYQNSDLKKLISLKLSEHRYNHTISVYKTALELAQIYNVPCEKAAIAALLHDYAKELPSDKKFALCKKFDIALDDITRKNPDLTHSFLSAELVRVELGINDAEILDAITYHTTGRKKMSKLEKVLYVADMIEPNREPYPKLENLRTLARKNLDNAVIEGLRQKIEYTVQKKKTVHPLSLDALEYFTGHKEKEEEKHD